MTARILIFGANGNVGRSLVRQMPASEPVRLLIRSELRDWPLKDNGIEITVGDLTNPASIKRALVGIEAVFLIWPSMTTEGAPEVLELIAQNASRLIYLSSIGVGSPQAQDDPIFAMHSKMENLIDASGIARTVLRSDSLASNTLAWAQQIRATGVVKGPMTAPTAVVDPRDLASVAAALLTRQSLDDQILNLTGPKVISRPEQIDAIGKAIGRKLVFEEVAAKDAREQLLADGRSAQLVDALMAAAEKRVASKLVSGDIQRITGRSARSFDEWAADHVAAFS